jgi:hypothetical protein
MMKSYHGSCHCGAVQFRCAMDLADGTSRCNCSMCWKGRFWKVIVPAESFELLAGEEMLAEYRFGSESIRHRFCRRCGIKPYGEGEHAAIGGRFYAVNLACVDDVPLEELLGAPIANEDGRHDRWSEAPDEAPVL